MSEEAKRRTAVQDLVFEAHDMHLHQRQDDVWKRLAEAHILSQPFAGLHTWVHWHMLKAAFRQMAWSEIIGQSLRILMAAPGSWLKRYPVGNTGLSNVSMFRPMPIPEELQEKIRKLQS